MSVLTLLTTHSGPVYESCHAAGTMILGRLGRLESHVDGNLVQTLLLLLTIVPEGLLDAMLASMLPYMLSLTVPEASVCAFY